MIFSYIAKSAHAQGKRVCILVHRHELLMQTSRALDKFGVAHGLISPKFTESKNQIQVASVQTLARRLKKDPTYLEQLDLLIVDEAHHTVSKTWADIIAGSPRARILGVTATPWRLSGEGLGVQAGGYYDELIIGPSMKDLIAMGFLSPYDLYMPPTELDLKGLRTKMGDFEKKELASRVDKPKVTGSAVEHYGKICPGAPAIAFCVSIEHAQHVAKDFRDAGYRAACVHGGLPDAERKRLIDGLENGSVQVLTSADLISEGTDVPCVAAAIMLRPTQSLTLWLQQIGRALRTHPSKQRSIILDHVGGTYTHGLPDEERDWSLDGDGGRKKKKKERALKVCEKCFCTYEPFEKKCPSCGHVPEVKGGSAREVEQASGELKKITEEDRIKIQMMRKKMVGEAKTEEQLREVAKKLGYKENWIYHIMQAREKKQQAGGRR